MKIMVLIIALIAFVRPPFIDVENPPKPKYTLNAGSRFSNSILDSEIR
jgi:hypothetical protein